MTVSRKHHACAPRPDKSTSEAGTLKQRSFGFRVQGFRGFDTHTRTVLARLHAIHRISTSSAMQMHAKLQHKGYEDQWYQKSEKLQALQHRMAGRAYCPLFQKKVKFIHPTVPDIILHVQSWPGSTHQRYPLLTESCSRIAQASMNSKFNISTQANSHANINHHAVVMQLSSMHMPRFHEFQIPGHLADRSTLANISHSSMT